MSRTNPKGANPNWHYQLIGLNGHRQTLLVQGKLRDAVTAAARKRVKRRVKETKAAAIKLGLDGLIDLESLFAKQEKLR